MRLPIPSRCRGDDALPFCVATHSWILVDRTFSGSAPAPSTSSWKLLRFTHLESFVVFRIVLKLFELLRLLLQNFNDHSDTPFPLSAAFALARSISF
jgi:hypothetical protein